MKKLEPVDTESYGRAVDLDKIVHSLFTYDSCGDFEIEQSDEVKQPVYVVGSPRSGTTVLGHCLGQNSHLESADESLYMVLLWRMFMDLHQGDNEKKYAPLAEFISATELLQSMQQFSDRIITSLTKKKSDAARFVDHTPWYGAITPFIETLYPDSNFVHIVRDGRQVVRSLTASWENGYRWAGSDIETRTKLWMYSVLRARQAEEHSSQRYTEVRYEHLCLEPERTIRLICNQIHVDFEKQMLSPLEVPVASPSRPNPQLSSAHLPKSTEELVGWPAGWSTEDRDCYLNIAGDLHQELVAELEDHSRPGASQDDR